jgi:hypothetical protein
MTYVTESTSGLIAESLKMPKFSVENIANIQSPGPGIKIKFTSQASQDSTIFKWIFGDETDPSQYTETNDRSIIHEYENPNTYIVKHQACLSDLYCCYNNDIPWCITSITVEMSPPETFSLVPLLGFGLLFGLFLSKGCGNRNNKMDCEKNDCKWIDIKKECVRKT